MGAAGMGSGQRIDRRCRWTRQRYRYPGKEVEAHVLHPSATCCRSLVLLEPGTLLGRTPRVKHREAIALAPTHRTLPPGHPRLLRADKQLNAFIFNNRSLVVTQALFADRFYCRLTARQCNYNMTFVDRDFSFAFCLESELNGINPSWFCVGAWARIRRHCAEIRWALNDCVPPNLCLRFCMIVTLSDFGLISELIGSKTIQRA